MSKIDQLIAKYCPEGIPPYPLSRIARYSDTKVDANRLDSTTFVGVDNLVANKLGRVDATYSANSTRLTEFLNGDVLIGNIRPYLKKIWLADRNGGCSGDVLTIRLREDYVPLIDPRYLYFVLSSDRFFKYNMQHAKGAKMPRGSKPAILNFPIQIPPPEVQREIVSILDTFTELEAESEAELEAELEARKQQYEYYQSRLLNLGINSETVPLSSVAEIGTGGRNSNQALAEGEYPFYTRGREIKFQNDFDFEEKAVITAGDGVGVGNVIHYVEGKYALHQRAYRISSIDPGFNTKFIFYLMKSNFSEYMQRKSVHASVTSVRKKMLDEYPVPKVSLEVQQQIISVLDEFDDLANDLYSGLPGEIAARRKQYEYYRDQLLTFNEKEPVV